MDLNMKIAVIGTALIVFSATSFAYYTSIQNDVIQLQGKPPEPKNIRKNSVTANFNQHHGYIESVDFNYTIVDKQGNEIETKVIDAINYFVEEDISGVTFPGNQSYAVKVEYWINQVLNKIKEDEGIDIE